MFKKFIVFLVILCSCQNMSSENLEQNVSSDSLESKLNKHFDEYGSELFRYSGLTYYGETITIFSKNQIEREINLFNEIRDSDILNKPNNTVFALCHNILIHSPEEGKSFLKLLNKPTTDDNILNLLGLEMIFAGEFGEQLILDNIESRYRKWSENWSIFLSEYAIYESSIPRIEKIYNQSNRTEIKVNMIKALTKISSLDVLDFIKQIIETTRNDDILEAAMFAYIEFVGYDGIEYVNNIKTIGQKSKKEKEEGLDWLKTGTSPKNKFGVVVENSMDFINRFGGIRSPVVNWANRERLLTEKNIKEPTALTKTKKNELIGLLIESKGVGLEMIKAQLFLSLEQTDIDKLLKLRQMCLYSPNEYTEGKLHTIGIFVRYLRKIRT